MTHRWVRCLLVLTTLAAVVSGCAHGVSVRETAAEAASGAELAPPWPGGIVPYQIEPSMLADSMEIRAVMRRWESGTPVRFILRRSNDAQYVSISRGRCVTSDGGQVTSVRGDAACIGHELGHALGLRHEHQRADRDRYLDVRIPFWWLWGKDQLEILEDQPLCRDFDMGSIMLYKDHAKISARPGLAIVKQDNVPSQGDLRSIRQLYGAEECITSAPSPNHARGLPRLPSPYASVRP